MAGLQLDLGIKAADEFERSAKATSAALDAIALQEAKINALSEKLGVSSKKVAAAQSYIAAEQKAQEKATADAVAAKSKGEEEFRDKLKAGAAGLYIMKDAAIAAYDSTVELAKAIGEAALEADKTRRGAAALINAFTGGNGPEVMKQLDAYADQLGQSIDETRAKFVQFREAGVNNQVAGQLLKIRADLIATGLSAQQADERIAPVLGAGRNTALAKIQIGFIEKAFDGVGSGAKAAAYAVSSVEGAQNKIQNATTEALADAWHEVGPSIGVAANELADFGVQLLKSDEGKSAINAIESAFKSLPGAVKGAIDGVKGFYDFVVNNKTAVVSALSVIGIAVATAFGPAIVAGTVAAATFAALPLAVGIAAVAVGAAVKEITDHWDDLKLAFSDGLAAVIQFGDEIFDTVSDVADDMIDAGAHVVDGLIEGIKGAIGGATAAVSDLASSITNEFKSALGIHSPSTVFAGYGANTVQGYNKGQERAISAEPPPLQVAADNAPSPSQEVAMMRQAPSAPSSAGGLSFVIQQLIVQGGGSADDNARAIRQEIQLLLQAGQLSRGGA